MEEIVQRFAHPALGPGRDLLNLITSEVASAAIDMALGRCAGESESLCPGMRDVLRAWVNARGEEFWHPRIGQLRFCEADTERRVPLSWLIELALSASLSGIPASWSFHLKEPASLWVNRWIFPNIMSGSVVTDQGRPIFALTDVEGDSRFYECASRALVSKNSAAVPGEMPDVNFTSEEHIYIVPDSLVDRDLLPLYPAAKFYTGDQLEVFAESLRETARLLALNSPSYLRWVSDVVRFVAPVATEGDLIGSSSSANFPGLVAIAHDRRPIAMAELLVHEASHQHFFIASCLGPIVEEKDEHLYYSEFSRRQRPLDRILAAFHALANMALFYRECLSKGISCTKRFAFVVDQMQKLDVTLRQADALTGNGKALWLPLSELCHQMDVTNLDIAPEHRVESALLTDSDLEMARRTAARDGSKV